MFLIWTTYGRNSRHSYSIKKMLIMKMIFLALILANISRTGLAAPADRGAYIQTLGSYIKLIPEGSVVQGSAAFGGIQPDYVIDFESSEFDNLRSYVDRVKLDPKLNLIKQVFLIRNAVSSLLEKKLYSDKSNYLLAQMYKEDGQDIPLSEYSRYRTGVCREHALILHQALVRLGVDSHFVYAKIKRETAEREMITEDHGFVTIKYNNKEWVIDAYFSAFHGFSMEDLVSGASRPARLVGVPEHSGFRQILHINDYPKIWIPKSTRALRCKQVMKN